MVRAVLTLTRGALVPHQLLADETRVGAAEVVQLEGVAQRLRLLGLKNKHTLSLSRGLAVISHTLSLCRGFAVIKDKPYI